MYYTRASAASDDENQGWISNDLKWQKGRWQSCRSPIQVLMRPPFSGRGCHNKLGYPPCGARTAWKSRGLERRIPRVLKTAPSIQNSIWIYGANIHALVSVARGHVGATLAVL